MFASYTLSGLMQARNNCNVTAETAARKKMYFVSVNKWREKTAMNSWKHFADSLLFFMAKYSKSFINTFARPTVTCASEDEDTSGAQATHGWGLWPTDHTKTVKSIYFIHCVCGVLSLQYVPSGRTSHAQHTRCESRQNRECEDHHNNGQVRHKRAFYHRRSPVISQLKNVLPSFSLDRESTTLNYCFCERE